MLGLIVCVVGFWMDFCLDVFSLMYEGLDFELVLVKEWMGILGDVFE